MKEESSTRRIARVAILAAIYALLTVLPPMNAIGYGPVQVRVAEALTVLPPEVVKQHRDILKMFGLRISCSDVDVKAVMKAMELDKKVKGKAVRWVLLEGIGQPVIRQDVPRQVVSKVLEELLGV